MQRYFEATQCASASVVLHDIFDAKGKQNWGKAYGILFNVGGQTGKDWVRPFSWTEGVKLADCWGSQTRNLSLRKRSMCTNHCTTGPILAAIFLKNCQPLQYQHWSEFEELVRQLFERMLPSKWYVFSILAVSQATDNHLRLLFLAQLKLARWFSKSARVGVWLVMCTTASQLRTDFV